MARIDSSFSKVVRSLEGDLIRGLAMTLPQEICLIPRYSLLADRWLLGSSLQKCIRRGLSVEATDVAIALHTCDREYAWRRLRIIALEDVGLGDIEMVASVMAVAGKRQLRGLLGDLWLFVAFVQSLAVAVKDRTACDLLCWIELSPDVARFRNKLLTEQGRWESLALDGDAAMWQRVVSLQLISGFTVKTQTGYRAISKANTDALWRVVEQLRMHPMVAFATLKATGTESLNVALPFAYLVREAASVRPICSRELEAQNALRIGGLIAPAYCMHTRLGLRALRLFLQKELGIRRELIRAGATNMVRALGFLLFQVESGMLDRVEDYAPAIRIEAERAELAHFGITGDEAGAALRMMLKERLPQLNKARKAVWADYLAELKAIGVPG